MNRQLKGSVYLIIASFVWGMAFSAQSDAMRYIQPFTFVFLRSAITCAVLLLAMPLFKRFAGDAAQDEPPMSRHLAVGALLGAMLFAATALQQVGLVYTTPAKSGFVTALYIVIVPILGLFLGQKVRWPVWLGVGLSLCGLFLLCVQEDLRIGAGDLLTLGSALAFSMQILTIGRKAGRLNAVKLTAIQFGTVAVLSGIIAFAAEKPSLDGMLACWGSVVYVGVFSGAVGYTLQVLGQKYAEPTLASVLMCLESVFAAVGGWVILGQTLSPRELLGCALMLSASVLAQIPPERFLRRRA